MIQRNVLKRARATRFNNLQSSTSISPRNLFLPLRIPISSTSRAPALRCYSSAPQAKSEVDGEASSTETNQPDQPPAEVSEDPSTKEIEAKDKEILDLKVSLPPPQAPPPLLHSIMNQHLLPLTGPLPPLSRRLP